MYLLTPSTVTNISDFDDKILYIRSDDLKNLINDEALRISFLKKLKTSQVVVAPISETGIKGVVNKYDRVNNFKRVSMKVSLPRMNVWGL